jgi:hypothetical protein
MKLIKKEETTAKKRGPRFASCRKQADYELIAAEPNIQARTQKMPVEGDDPVRRNKTGGGLVAAVGAQ